MSSGLKRQGRHANLAPLFIAESLDRLELYFHQKTEADTGQQFCALASDRKDRVYFKGAEETVQLYEAWRKLRNEKFHELYYPRNITRMDQWRKRIWVEQAAQAVETTNARKRLAGKPEDKIRPIDRHRHRKNGRMWSLVWDVAPPH